MSRVRAIPPILPLLAPVVLFTFPARASVIEYDGDLFPEDAGFERVGTYDVDRWLSEGWFHQYVELGQWAPPPNGEYDFYDYDLPSFVGSPFFIEWRMISDAPASEVDHQNGASLVVLVGGPVTYHFNISSTLVQFYTGHFPNLYFTVDPAVAHVYRLDVYAGDWFEFRIDDALVFADVPESVFPTPDALMSFGAGYYRAESTSAWDYVKFGAIPEPATGLLFLGGAALMVARHRRRRA